MRSSPLILEAIGATLDRIEETATQAELDELNDALHFLRSCRQQTHRKGGPGSNSEQATAA